MKTDSRKEKFKGFLMTVVSLIQCTAKATGWKSWGSITGKGNSDQGGTGTHPAS
jgi:hypothetical protein